MKIQLDTKSKTIKLDESVNLGELQELLEKFLPDGQWKEFKLETNTVINNWASPIVIDRYVYPRRYPWWNDQITVGGTYNHTPQKSLSDGVYCLSVNN